jgi:hypothetical protein
MHYDDWLWLVSASNRRTVLDGALTRRMSIAMAISATIHLVVIVSLGRVLTAELFPSLASVPLLVLIDSQTATPERSVASTARPITPPGTEPPKPAYRDRVQPDQPATGLPLATHATEAVPDPGDDAVRLAEIQVVEARRATRLVESNALDGGGSATDPAIARKKQTAEARVPIQANYSARQEEMLARKVREWSEELHRIADSTAELSWKHDGQEYVARFVEQPPDDDMDIDRVLVEISTLVDGDRLMSALELKRLAFSNFAQFVNRWDPDVQIHDDQMDGRFHANSMIRLAYDRRTRPVFHNKVTTSAPRVDITSIRGPVRKRQIFPGGLETGVPVIRLPRHYVPFPDEVSLPAAEVHRLTGDTRIEFLADGSYTLNYMGSDHVGQTGQAARGVTYFLADEGASVHVRGVVNGKVLVYSPARIVVEGDLVYEQDPRAVPESDDYLGLVSDGYVDVAAPGVTGPGDLVIHAAIYARRRFAVRNTRSDERAELRLYGSLSAGTVSATEPRYATRIQFDQRLTEVRPPGFPLTDRYEVESWDKRWTTESSH